MGLKILHSADWHLDSPFTGFSAEQRLLLRQKQRQIPNLVENVLRRENCDLVLLAGDIFDGTPQRETVSQLQRVFRQWGVPVFIAPGNHDFCGPGSIWQEEAWPENVHVFTGGWESVAIPELDCRIWGAGYQSMDCPGLLEGFVARGEETYQIGILHADPLGSGSAYCPVTDGQVRQSGLDYLALGHIHKADAFRSGQTLCAWPGCPMGRGWDETGEKGLYIVNLEETATVRQVLLNTVRFYNEQAEVTALSEVLPPVKSENFYRVTLTGFGPVDWNGLGQAYGYLPNLQWIDRTEPVTDLWAEVGEDTLRGVYFRQLQGLSREEPLAVLAAQISRKILAGSEVILP